MMSQRPPRRNDNSGIIYRVCVRGMQMTRVRTILIGVICGALCLAAQAQAQTAKKSTAACVELNFCCDWS